MVSGGIIVTVPVVGVVAVLSAALMVAVLPAMVSIAIADKAANVNIVIDLKSLFFIGGVSFVSVRYCLLLRCVP